MDLSVNEDYVAIDDIFKQVLDVSTFSFINQVAHGQTITLSELLFFLMQILPQLCPTDLTKKSPPFLYFCEVGKWKELVYV